MGILSSIKTKALNFLLNESDIDEIQAKANPLINYQTFYTFNTTTPSLNYAMLWLFVKQTPEVVSVLTAIAEDIVSDYELYPLGGKKGRNRIQKADKMLKDNNAKQELISMVLDALVTGDGYLWKGKVSDIQVKNCIDNIVKESPIEFKSLDDSKKLTDRLIWELKAENEDMFGTKTFASIASATMFANYDEHGNILKWTQKIGPKREEFEPDEIIHYRYLRINGEFYGFSPLRALIVELNILRRLKEYYLSYFERGGQQNIFVLEEENPTTDSYKLFRKELLRAAQAPERWKNMVVTGKVNKLEVNPSDKEMEFRDLAKYITNVIIMAWNVPSTRLSDVLSATGQRNSANATLSTEGYYRKISQSQDMLEDLVNRFILKDYGVELKFTRTYKEDEVRQVQIDKMRTDTVEQRLRLGVWNEDAVWDYLNVDEEDRGKIDTEQIKMGGTGQLNQNLLNKHQLMGSPHNLDSQIKQNSAKQKKSLVDKYGVIIAEDIMRNM